MVASHTAVPLGTAKWLERAIPTPVTLPLGKGQGLLMSPTQGQAYIIEATLAPAISQPLWGSCMAGYHCLMPTAFPISKRGSNLIAPRHLFFETATELI